MVVVSKLQFKGSDQLIFNSFIEMVVFKSKVKIFFKFNCCVSLFEWEIINFFSDNWNKFNNSILIFSQYKMDKINSPKKNKNTRKLYIRVFFIWCQHPNNILIWFKVYNSQHKIPESASKLNSRVRALRNYWID